MSVQERMLISPVMSGAAGTVDTTAVVYPFTENATIERAYIVPTLAVAADASDTITITATFDSQNIFSFATTTGAGGALTKDTPVEQTILTALSGTKRELTKGSVVTFGVAKANSGKAYELHVVLVYKLVN